MQIQEADAIQWAISLADSKMKRNDRSQVEKNYLFDLEQMLQKFEKRTGTKAYRQPTA